MELIPLHVVRALICGLLDTYSARAATQDDLKFLLELDETLDRSAGRAAGRALGVRHINRRREARHRFFISRTPSHARVLDVGCGGGHLSYDLAKKAGAQVVAMDLIKVKIVQAQHQNPHPRVSYLLGDAVKNPPSPPYDIAVLSGVLEHMEDRAGFLKALMGAAGPGKILLRVPQLDRDWRVLLGHELGAKARNDEGPYTEYTQESLVCELAEAGLVIGYQENRFGEIWAEAVPLES